ncbi:MAG: alpha/beta hydrolase [Dehalococcoidia bacterium]|nr:alpha/beta hydrolase [Dehalococcoidia bacterium]
MPKIKAGNIELYYESEGTGEPILFIAGLGLTHRAWDKQLAPLSKRFRCITFDNRDAGQSQSTPEAYSVGTMADDAAALLQVLRIPKANVIGFSMGGAISQELAINHPGIVNKLCLIATYSSGDPRGTANLTAWSAMRQLMQPEQYIRATLPWVYSYQDYKIPGLVEAAVNDYVNNPDHQPVEQYKRQVYATTTHFTEDRLNLIKAPTQLIFGSDDILTPMRFVKTLQAGIKNSSLTLVEGTGHGLLWARASEINTALMKFLSEAGNP